MDIHTDALKFQDLSIQYREQIARGNDKAAEETMKEIKNLISFTAERIRNAYNLDLAKKTSSLKRGVGLPLIGASAAQIAGYGHALKMKHLTTLDTRSEKRVSGCNIILDYSGSMWFDGMIHTIDGLMRIYAQNFVALVLSVYLQQITNGEMVIQLTPYSMTALPFMTSDILNADWDMYIVHSQWGSGTETGISGRNPRFKPSGLSACDEDWFCNVYPYESIKTSIKEWEKKKMGDFINIILTDGGMHRKNETTEDRLKFLQDSFRKISEKGTVALIVVATQQEDLIRIANELNMYSERFETDEKYNNVFLHLTHLINKTRVET